MMNGFTSLRTAIAFVIAVVAAGCGTINPQTRNEFKQLISESPRMGLTDTYTTNRRFDDVVRALDAKWQECYNVAVTTSRSQGSLTTMRYQDIYHPRSQKINKSLVEMTLQQTTKGMMMLDKVPPGGYYFVALDVERLPANKTRLTWYSYSLAGWSRHWERNKLWSEGKNVACDAEV